MSQNNAQDNWRNGLPIQSSEGELQAWYAKSPTDPTLELRTTGAGSVTAILAEGTEAHIPVVSIDEEGSEYN